MQLLGLGKGEHPEKKYRRVARTAAMGQHKAIVMLEASAENVVHDRNEEQWSERITLEDAGGGAELFGRAMTRVNESTGVAVEVYNCCHKSTRKAVVVE